MTHNKTRLRALVSGSIIYDRFNRYKFNKHYWSCLVRVHCQSPIVIVQFVRVPIVKVFLVRVFLVKVLSIKSTLVRYQSHWSLVLVFGKYFRLRSMKFLL